MKKVILSVIAVLLLSLLLFTCTEESNPIDNNTPVIDPITNTWTVQSDSNYTIFFRTFDSTATKGVFWGAENHPNIGSTDLCGFFDGVYIEFDVKRPFDGRLKFKGKFIDSNRMEIQSSEGYLVLTR
jgi:hypothetical protein